MPIQKKYETTDGSLFYNEGEAKKYEIYFLRMEAVQEFFTLDFQHFLQKGKIGCKDVVAELAVSKRNELRRLLDQFDKPS